MDGAYAHLAACYKRTTDHCIAELNGCLTPGAWLKSSCQAGRFFQESLLTDAGAEDDRPNDSGTGTDRVHQGGSGEVDEAQLVEPAGGVPFPAAGNRIDDAYED